MAEKKAMKNPTHFPDLNELLNDFVSAHQDILGNNLIGVYLQGSAAVGDMDVYSDVDFVIVTERPLTEMNLGDLQQMTAQIHDRKSENHWAEHLEGSYFPLDVLQSFDSLDTKLIYTDNGSSELEWDTHCNTLVVRWCLREYGIPLFGPAAATLLDPVSADLLKAEISKDMLDWSEGIFANGLDSNRFYQIFIAVSYCRTLHSLATGRVYSKPAGVKWAYENLDPEWHDLLDQVTADRADSGELAHQPADPVEMQRTLDFVTYACEQIRQMGGI